MTTEQPRTTASADNNGRLTPDGLRRGVSRWWYIIFLGSLTFDKTTPDADDFFKPRGLPE